MSIIGETAGNVLSKAANFHIFHVLDSTAYEIWNALSVKINAPLRNQVGIALFDTIKGENHND